MSRAYAVWMGVWLSLLLAGCSAKVELLSQVSEAQANEVLAALVGRGIAAEKLVGKEGLVALQVESARIADALAIMRAEGLPRAAHAHLGDVFKKEGLISSPLEERARMVYALSQELAGTLSHIDGVLNAEVHVVLPERAGFGEAGNPSSAAVFIKHQDVVDMKAVVPQIRRLVANSISGLEYDKVSVVLVPSASHAASHESTPTLQSVLGIAVSSDAATRLRWTLSLIGGLAGLTGLAGSMLWHRWRYAK